MSHFEICAELERAATPFAVVTFTSGRGHLPQEPGAKAVVTAAGLVAGTVGGGKVEARLVEEAQARLRDQQAGPVSYSWNLQTDLLMTCGGEMSFLVEVFFPRAWSIVIYGGGHVAQALVRVLAGLEARLICVEARAEWREKLPALPQLEVRDWIEPSGHLPELPRGAFHVVVTQDHSSDLPILHAISLHQPDAPYVGVIGSATKAAKLRRELKALGCSDSFLEKLRCPMGLPIGGSKPGEIAISVAAQLLQFYSEEQKL